jgi:hypothetical protein
MATNKIFYKYYTVYSWLFFFSVFVCSSIEAVAHLAETLTKTSGATIHEIVRYFVQSEFFSARSCLSRSRGVASNPCWKNKKKLENTVFHWGFEATVSRHSFSLKQAKHHRSSITY